MGDDKLEVFCTKDERLAICDETLLRSGGFSDIEYADESKPHVYKYTPFPVRSWALEMMPKILEGPPYDVADDHCIGVLEVAHFFDLEPLQRFCLALLAKMLSLAGQDSALALDIQDLNGDIQLDLLDHLLDLDGCGWSMFEDVTSGTGRLHIEPKPAQVTRHAALGTGRNVYRGNKRGIQSIVFKVKFTASMKCYSVDESACSGVRSDLFLWDLNHQRPVHEVPEIIDATLGPAGHMFITTPSGELVYIPCGQSELVAGEDLGWRACIFATSTLLVALPTNGLQNKFKDEPSLGQERTGKMWIYAESKRVMEPASCPFRAGTRSIEFAPNHEFAVHATKHSLEISRYHNAELYDTKELVDMRTIRTWRYIEAGERVHVAISPESGCVAVIHGDNISIWGITLDDFPDGTEQTPKLALHAYGVQQPAYKASDHPACLTHSPDGKFLAIISFLGQLDILRNDGASMSKVASIDCLFDIWPKERWNFGTRYVKSVAWSPFEDLLAVGMDCGVETIAVAKYLRSHIP